MVKQSEKNIRGFKVYKESSVNLVISDQHWLDLAKRVLRSPFNVLRSPFPVLRSPFSVQRFRDFSTQNAER
jgi:hypothetical protein